MKYIYFLFIFFLIMSISCACNLWTVYNKATPQTVHKSVAEIVVKNGNRFNTGTIFAVSKDKFLTASHVCDNYTKDREYELWVVQNQYMRRKSIDVPSILGQDHINDLCLLRIKDTGLVPLKFSFIPPKIGDKIFIYGFSRHTPVLTEGHILVKKIIWFNKDEPGFRAQVSSAESVGGVSGSPVINEEGFFVGVNIGSWNEFHHRSFSTRYENIKKFLGEHYVRSYF